MALSTNVRFFLYMLLIALIAKGLTEGRSLKRRHGHRLHPNSYDTEESLPGQLFLRHLRKEDSNPNAHDSSKQRSVAYRSGTRAYSHPLSSGARRKRHNGGHSTVTYRKMTDQDRGDFLKYKKLNTDWISLLNNEHGRLFDEYYELEVKQAQNSSICNYTVVTIPDTKGTRMPKNLEHVICNHVGSSCQSAGTYCCIQTYRKVEVSYADNTSEIMKIYAGCVCARQLYGQLDDADTTLPIND